MSMPLLDRQMLGTIALRLQSGKKLVLLHGNADPDALGCAFAIYRSFPHVDVVAPGGLDRLSKVIGSKFDFKIAERPPSENYDVTVILDTSSPDQLGSFDGSLENCIVIDHHTRTERWPACTYYCDERKRSCAEIVYDLLKEAGIQIGKDVGLALMIGMLTDSGHLNYATPALLRSFAEILEETGQNIDEVMDLIEVEQDISERISQLKGAQRLKFERTDGFIVALSHGSAFESSVCKSLIGLGADVAFVGSQRDENFRVSARARPEIVRMGLHLGKLLGDVGTETSNDGGGHGGAAGLVGVGDVEAILNICSQRAIDFIRSYASNGSR
jgi:nanoRNase/pAp phosphatase (c-di-AMP/oligoRNAs hydrolase)